jgi:uncharacterized protein with NAD-binding domain and iron-sulfur cluster
LANHKQRVAIVGGGVAAMAAAWDLTSGANNNLYDVTIFQIGGRLGGKGASSRNRDRNPGFADGNGFGDRNEEHGLHLWLGYYENAFRMIRQCFDELQKTVPNPRVEGVDEGELDEHLGIRPAPFDNWNWLAAFKRSNLVGLADDSSGNWVPWIGRFPEYVHKDEEGVTGIYRFADGTAIPGIHIVEDKREAYPGEEEEEADRLAHPDVSFFLLHALRLLQAFIESLELRVEQRYAQEVRKSGALPPDDPEELLSQVMNLHPLTHRDSDTGSSPDLRRVLVNIRLMLLMPAIQSFAAIAGLSESTILFPGGSMPVGGERAVAMLDRYIAEMREKIEWFVDEDLAVRRLWELIDLLAANIRGLIAAGLVGRDDFSQLDGWNYEDWLRMNRIADRTLKNPIIRGAYDLALAYQDGDPRNPQLAAGQALNAACRFFFMYKGALFWRMTAGMGDVVFAPLYLALRKRGVKFRFFHRLEDIELDDAGTTVTRLKFLRQVRFDADKNISTSPTNYKPLEVVHFDKGHKAMSCWRRRPDLAQLYNNDPVIKERLRSLIEDTDANSYANFESVWCTWPEEYGDVVFATVGAARRTEADDSLNVGNYDHVVVTVPIAALKRVSRKLAEKSLKWKSMLDNIGTVATQSVQLWVNKETAELGWPHGRVNFSGFVHPFDTWADLSDVIKVENQGDARGVHYFCCVLPEKQIPQTMRAPNPQSNQAKNDTRPAPNQIAEVRETVKENVKRFLDEWVFQLWPDAVHRYPNVFRWEYLVDPRQVQAGRPAGPERLDVQHIVANVDPSERYTQSLPGTTKFRIRPFASGFSHLFIAGDWTDCGLNFGCVEAAVISGRLASYGISGYPDKTRIPGYGTFVERAAAI